VSERRASVFTHRRPAETAPALGLLVEAARSAGWKLLFSELEAEKHGLGADDVIAIGAGDGADLAFALGGDGTVLNALRTYAGTGVPVFGVNYGEVGFLATIDPDDGDVADWFARALAGDFETLALPSIEAGEPAEGRLAINDVAIHRRPGLRVADLAYAVGPDEIGRVRCDGLVVATPAGSTGYNLANGGPVMAWGVEGFVVSVIAPHSLTARSLVVAPNDPLVIHNRSQDEPVDVTIDGRPACGLDPGDSIELRFGGAKGTLAQVAGASFYHRLRQKFGRLATES
jgi:NAD+ kinase